MFDNKHYSTKGPYKYFLWNGGFCAFPNAIILRLDIMDIRNVNPVEGSFQCSIKLLMNTIETKYDEDDNHLYKFMAKMKNCISKGEDIFNDNKTEGYDGDVNIETGFNKQYTLWKEVKDGDQERNQKKWIYAESFASCMMENETFSESFELH